MVDSFRAPFGNDLAIAPGTASGISPVVGVPLVSDGGASMLMRPASFGVPMLVQTHRKMLRA